MAGNINEEDGSSTNILDPHTGKRLHKTPGLAHFAWADNKRLVAWDIAPGSNGLRSRLVLVTIGSDETVPLSGSSQVQNLPFGHWTPLFAQR